MSVSPSLDRRDLEDRVKQSLQLPQTEFALRGGLKSLEPALLEHWKVMDLLGRQRRARVDQQRFVLHDGPPYANGALHIGHALNKILKDLHNRFAFMNGRDVRYVPGWDCHGLPIGWKVEEAFRDEGRLDVPVDEYRAACRAFAQKWVSVQREQFLRLGVQGDWDHAYTTMTPQAEARIAQSLLTLLREGYLTQAERPVWWSVVEGTALAEAEIEYQAVRSEAVTVGFPLVEAKGLDEALVLGSHVAIWTTTPWTLPSSQAIAVNPAMTYQLIVVEHVQDGARVCVGQKIWVAASLVDAFCQDCSVRSVRPIVDVQGAALVGAVAAHPLACTQGSGEDYRHAIPVVSGGHVDDSQGTGFVHMAPAHGIEDFLACKEAGIPARRRVDRDGRFFEDVALFANLAVMDVSGRSPANGVVIAALEQAGKLYGRKSYEHEYPHSWRSKKPLIQLMLPQWFVVMDEQGLRKAALEEIDRTVMLPTSGARRLSDMVSGRPDWCLSRQRTWGVPLVFFVHRQTGEPLIDADVADRIVQIFRQEGSDSWFSSDPQRFLGDRYGKEDYEQVQDVADVWFESGCSFAYVLEDREELSVPADLYLEGSDQHRGWFQSSLLAGTALIGRAPFEKVVTHGFVLDEDRRKMSKSLGNTTVPAQIVDTQGADVLRLWVAMSNTFDDLRIGPQVLSRTQDYYRRFRNTLRWLLANRATGAASVVPVDRMPLLERWIHHRLAELGQRMPQQADNGAFYQFYRDLHIFCTRDLSSLYFDVRKDVLYCGALDDPLRICVQQTISTLFDHLVRWLAPALPFTTEEAWLVFRGIPFDRANPTARAKTLLPHDPLASIHLQSFPAPLAEWLAPNVAQAMDRWLAIRSVVLEQLEKKRMASVLRASIEAEVEISSAGSLADVASLALSAEELADLCVVSRVIWNQWPDASTAEVPAADMVVRVARSSDDRCLRCWRHRVPAQSVVPLCARCAPLVERDPLEVET